jgi:hypothetical protein
VRADEFSEVEILDRERKSGSSHYGLGRVFEVVRDLWTIPFAGRGVENWLPRFRGLQWLLSAAGVALAILGHGWWAVAIFLLALASWSNARNLARFVEARMRPPFRIKEFR